MISYIRGELQAIGKDLAIIDVNGVGFGIFMSGTSLAQLPQIGKEVKIYTYLDVREDALQLFGFMTKEERELFQLIIRVSGIGPRGGLNILSALSADELRFAVLSGNTKAITAAPGIGKKTAEKLIIELKDQLSLEPILNQRKEADTALTAVPADRTQNEALEALMALGYGSAESLKAVRSVFSNGMSVEETLKAALKYLF